MLKQAVYIFILIFFPLQSLLSQDKAVLHRVDSLKKIIQSTNEDTVRINCLREWDNLIYYEDPETDLKLNFQIADECEKRLKENNLSTEYIKFYQRSAASAYNNLGSIFQFRGEMKKSLAYMRKSLKLYQKVNFLPGLSNIYGNLGISYSIMGDGKNASIYMLKALKVQKKLKDDISIAATYNNLALIYRDQGLNEKALEYCHKALEIRLKIKDDKGIAAAYANLASMYFDDNELEKSLEYLQKAEDIQNTINDPVGKGQVYHNFGSYYDRIKNPDKALDYFKKAIEIRNETGEKRGLSSSYRSMASIFYSQGNLSEALSSGERALDLARSADAVEMIRDASELLKKIYASKKEYGKAYEMSELFNTMKDSIFNEETRKSTLRQNMEYEFQTQKIKDSLYFAKREEMNNLALDKEKAESREKDIALKNAAIIRYTLFGGLVLVIVFFYFLYNRFKLIRHQKQIIEERNRDIVDSINYAQRIQRSILPSVSKFDETFDEYFILYIPKDVVSGDFYWLETVHTTVKTELRDKVSVLAAVDCTGHGVPGALMSVVGNTLLNQTIKNPDINSPGEALDFLNRELPKNLKKQNSNDVVRDGMDIAMCAIDRKSGKLYFAGANNPLYHLRKNQLTEYKGDKQSISGADDIPKSGFTNHVVSIESGDSVYLFSDGYADQFGSNEKKESKSGGKKFKYKRLKELLAGCSHLPMTEQKNLLEETIMAWKGDLEQTDDILIIGIRI